jgi:hypothetical protein
MFRTKGVEMSNVWSAPLSSNCKNSTVRWYMEDGMQYPCISVTSVLGLIVPDGLKEWFIRTEAWKVNDITEVAGQKGTDIHNILEEISKGNKVEVPEKWRDLINKYHEYISKFDEFEVLEVEKAVYHKEYGYAGRVDLIVKVNGKVEVWDWKTGRMSVHSGWQLGAYKLALEDYYDYKIDGMRVISVSHRMNKVEDLVYKHFDFCTNAFLKALDVFRAEYFNVLVRGVNVPDTKERLKFPIEVLTKDCAYDFKQRGSHGKEQDTDNMG